MGPKGEWGRKNGENRNLEEIEIMMMMSEREEREKTVGGEKNEDDKKTREIV
jgi:hypothetical protein